MIYAKSILSGIVSLAGCVALATAGLFAIGIDLRALMSHFPWISLPAIGAIFAAGFFGQFRWSRGGNNRMPRDESMPK